MVATTIPSHHTYGSYHNTYRIPMVATVPMAATTIAMVATIIPTVATIIPTVAVCLLSVLPHIRTDTSTETTGTPNSLSTFAHCNFLIT